MTCNSQNYVKIILFVVLSIVIASFLGIAFAQSPQITISANKQSYTTNDTITISGTISNPGASNSAVLQVYDPYNILIQIGNVNLSSDGKFSTSIKAEGPSWKNDGTYTIKIIYVSPPTNLVAQQTIGFKAGTIVQNIQQPSIPANNTVKQNATIAQDQQTPFEEQVKQRIEFAKKLREALNSSKQESQGTETANQNNTIPFWVKDTARRWHDGAVDNESFGKVIQYMISAGLVTPKYAVTPSDAFEHIPFWLKNTAQWWTQGIVSDETFYDSIQYLLDKNIIKP